MSEFLRKLFSSDFMGHGYCYLWRPEIIWLHAISDSVIALSYYFIPCMLVYLVRKRRDLPFHWIFVMFGVFILSCGTTHAMELWTLWHGTYRLAGLIKAITAASSLATAVALAPMVPKALLLPSPTQLRAVNLDLEKEIAERRRVEVALQEKSDFIAAVLNTVGTLIIVFDLRGTIEQCNQASEKVSGWKTEELVGRNIWELFAFPEEGKHLQDAVEQMRGGWRPGAIEAHLLARDGATPLISWSTTVLTDASGNHIIAAGVDVTEAKRLEKAILDISAREQGRIAQDLHDGLGQHLTGIAFMIKLLESKLSDQGRPEATDARQIVHEVNEAIKMTRELARGLLPVRSESEGLMSALEQSVEESQTRFRVECIFTCKEPILIHDDNVATHLYRIAQEAVNNAIKHGLATRIEVRLEKEVDGIEMSVRDNGVGLPENPGSRGGIGLRIMNYRANLIGGTLKARRDLAGGTIVTCHLQLRALLPGQV